MFEKQNTQAKQSEPLLNNKSKLINTHQPSTYANPYFHYQNYLDIKKPSSSFTETKKQPLS